MAVTGRGRGIGVSAVVSACGAIDDVFGTAPSSGLLAATASAEGTRVPAAGVGPDGGSKVGTPTDEFA